MIIIAGHELVNAENRDKYVDAFCDLVSRAREFDGCVHIAITADSVDPERINSRGVARCRSAEQVAKAGQSSTHSKAQVLGRKAIRRDRR